MLALLLIGLVALIALILLFGRAAVLNRLGQISLGIVAFAAGVVLLVMVDDIGQFLWIVGSIIGGSLILLAVVAATLKAKMRHDMNVARESSRAKLEALDPAARRSEEIRERTVLRLVDRGMTCAEAADYLALIDAGEVEKADAFFNASLDRPSPNPHPR